MEKVIVIGGGPAGLSAAIYLARASFSPLVFAGSPPGGQLTLTSEVENFPGYESILGAGLIDKMRKQAEKFGARIVDENVLKVDFSERPFKVYLSDSLIKFLSRSELASAKGGPFAPYSSSESEGSLHQSLAQTSTSQKNFISSSVVLIATGAKALWLGLESEERLRGKGVSACATCDGFFFREKTVAVVGGGDTALEEALTLTKFAQKVYLIHRRDRFRASKIMQKRVFNHPKIEIIWNTTVNEILGKEKVEGIRIKTSSSTNDSTEKILKVDGLFVAIGHKPDTDLFKGQINLDEKGYVITSERLAMELAKGKDEFLWRKIIEKFDFNYRMRTSVDGVFAAGDCVDNVYRQAATAAGQGVAAALEIERWLGEK